jgi:hypothetical protein
MEEKLTLNLYVPNNPLVAGSDAVTALLTEFAQAAHELVPEEIRANEQSLPFSVEAAKQVLHTAASDLVTMHLLGDRVPELLYTLAFLGTKAPLGLWISASASLSWFDSAMPERSSHLVELVAGLSNLCRPTYGFAHSNGDGTVKVDPHFRDPYAANGVYAAYWLNVYGKDLVDKIGPERMGSTTVAYRQELRSGGMLWLTSMGPQEYANPKVQSLRNAALVHLRDSSDATTSF